jgi:hypothetical protein
LTDFVTGGLDWLKYCILSATIGGPLRPKGGLSHISEPAVAAVPHGKKLALTSVEFLSIRGLDQG